MRCVSATGRCSTASSRCAARSSARKGCGESLGVFSICSQNSSHISCFFATFTPEGRLGHISSRKKKQQKTPSCVTLFGKSALNDESATWFGKKPRSVYLESPSGPLGAPWDPPQRRLQGSFLEPLEKALIQTPPRGPPGTPQGTPGDLPGTPPELNIMQNH